MRNFKIRCYVRIVAKIEQDLQDFRMNRYDVPGQGKFAEFGIVGCDTTLSKGQDFGLDADLLASGVKRLNTMCLSSFVCYKSPSERPI